MTPEPVEDPTESNWKSGVEHASLDEELELPDPFADPNQTS
jgi:hypothetical protein